MSKAIKRSIYFFLSLIFLSFEISSCAPLLVGGALAGGGYAGYKAHEKGYRIKITKEAKGTKVKKDNTKKSDENNKGTITNGE